MKSLKNIALIMFLLISQQAIAADESKWDAFIQEAAAQTGVSAALIKAVAKQESAFRDDIAYGEILSNAGAIGVMQVMPATGAEMGYSVEALKDPKQNIMAGATYLAKLMKMFDGNLTLVMAAYNAGPGNVRKYNGVPPFSETIPYVKKVAKNYAEYSGNSINLASLPSPTVDGGRGGIPMAIVSPTTIGDFTQALASFEASTGKSATFFKKVLQGIIVFLAFITAALQILHFWIGGVSQNRKDELGLSMINSGRALFLVSLFLLFII